MLFETDAGRADRALDPLRPSFLLAFALLASASYAQNAAVSSYLNPNDDFPGDIRIKEVRVPQKGYTLNTFYCVLGWSGTVGGASGYGGIQYSSAGGNNYIYSIWNNSTTAAYLDAKMVFTPFGGEGTGVHAMTYAYPWTPGYWNVLADRAWDVGGNTYSGFFARDGKTGVWRHLITMNMPIAHERYAGSTYNFLEDWTGSGDYRQSNVRRGWKRNDATKKWFAITRENYSVNAADLNTRSANKKTNWRGGTASDSSGDYFYMEAGGDIASTGNSGQDLTLARAAGSPQEEYGMGRVLSLSTRISSDKSKLLVTWVNDSLSVPQFAYQITIKDGGAIVKSQAKSVPQSRSDTLDIAGLTPDTRAYTVTLSITDIFDAQADPVSAPMGSSANSGIHPADGSAFEAKMTGSRLAIHGASSPRIEIVNLSGKNLAAFRLSGSREYDVDLAKPGLRPGTYAVFVHANGRIRKLTFLLP